MRAISMAVGLAFDHAVQAQAAKLIGYGAAADAGAKAESHACRVLLDLY